jgi:hypothetical protein
MMREKKGMKDEDVKSQREKGNKEREKKVRKI